MVYLILAGHQHPDLVWIHERWIPGDFRRRTWPFTFTRECLTALLIVLLIQTFPNGAVSIRLRHICQHRRYIAQRWHWNNQLQGRDVLWSVQSGARRAYSHIQPPVHLNSELPTRSLGICRNYVIVSDVATRQCAKLSPQSLTFYRPIESTVDIPCRWGLSREAGATITGTSIYVLILASCNSRETGM